MARAGAESVCGASARLVTPLVAQRTQVVGRKRFVLSPPADHASMYLHPYAHPSHRCARAWLRRWLTGAARAQAVSGGPRAAADRACAPLPAIWQRKGAIGILSACSRRATRVRACGGQGYVAELSPGWLLYLPPFWLHRVEGITPSISVNIWSDSLEGVPCVRVAPRYAALHFSAP